jgi:cell division protein FtsB
VSSLDAGAGVAVDGQPSSRGRARLTPRGALLALITVGLLLYMVVPIRTYLQQRDRLDQLERQTQVLRQQNATLQKEVDRFSDPAYLEQIARACLGMVKPGEISFVAVPRGQHGQPSGPAPDCG